MEFLTIKPVNKLEMFLKNILFFESELSDVPTHLPFYADGYPGIIYLETENEAYLQPANKKLSSFFLYGQTVEPISISIYGRFKLLIFQLSPFAAKVLLGINPKELKDDCFDLNHLKKPASSEVILLLKGVLEVSGKIEIISSYIESLIEESSTNPSNKLQLAINLIIDNKGKISIKDIREKLFITERTLERQFLDYIGVSPKQFAQIIQFQFSLCQLSEGEYDLLTDVVYKNGFADQSHFIRNFKRFTGQTPSEFQKQMANG